MTTFEVQDTDLFLVGVDKSRFLERRTMDFAVGTAVALGCIVPALLVSRGGLLVLLVLMSGLLGFRLSLNTTLAIRREARARRRHLEMATAVFLELINVMLAGGAGLETSITAAADAGDGPGFSLLRLATIRAQSARVPYWESFSRLGNDSGVDCLVELAHTMQLSAESGARVRDSLTVKAQSLRKKNLIRIEHDEEQRTEKIGLPLVVLFLGFLGLVGYPAFDQAMTSL